MIYLIFAFQKLKISVPRDPYFPVISGLQNTHFRTKDDTLKPVSIEAPWSIGTSRVSRGALSKMITSYKF